MLDNSSISTPPHKNRLSDLRGLGAEIWQGVDAQELDELELDSKPTLD